MPKNSKNRKLWGYLYVMIGTMHMGAKYKTTLIDWVVKGAGVGTYTFKKGTYFQTSYLRMTQTISMLIFNKNLLAQPQKNPQTFGYYIKTENYEVFIPKIAREVYDLEHRKLRKRKLRGRKLRGHSVCMFYCVYLFSFFEKFMNKNF